MKYQKTFFCPICAERVNLISDYMSEFVHYCLFPEDSIYFYNDGRILLSGDKYRIYITNDIITSVYQFGKGYIAINLKILNAFNICKNRRADELAKELLLFA